MSTQLYTQNEYYFTILITAVFYHFANYQFGRSRNKDVLKQYAKLFRGGFRSTGVGTIFWVKEKVTQVTIFDR